MISEMYTGQERQIAEFLVKTILECEAVAYDVDSVQSIVGHACEQMRGMLFIYRHNFITRLCSELTALTGGHPATRLIIEFLEIEREYGV